MPAMTAQAGQERVAKIMARRGMCSRREAERLIDAGSVQVDGVVVREQGVRAALDADIQLLGSGREWTAQAVTVLLNKPRGVVSTQPEGDQQPAWQLLTQDRLWGKPLPAAVERVLAKPWTLSVAGRLDRDSRGLLLLTQDGVLARAVTGSHRIPKRYLVTCDRAVTPAQLQALRALRDLEGQPIKAMDVRPAGQRQLRFRLVEGKKHHIRRACAAVELMVTDLIREGLGPWDLGKLPEGKWTVADAESVAEVRRQG